MQSSRLLISVQRCSSASRVQHLLRRCLLRPQTTIEANFNNFSRSLVATNRFDSSSSLKRNCLITIRTEQSFRYASSANLPTHKKIALPALSPTMETGTLRSWSKKEGDKIAEGDILAEIETDKATLGFESGDEGYLAKIVIPGGSKDVPVGKLCAIIVEKAEDVAAFKDFTDDGAAAPASKPKSADEPAAKAEKVEKEAAAPVKKDVQSEKKATSSAEDGRVVASPLAKKLAQEKGIDLQNVQGSGPQGRIVAEDVEKFIKEGGAKAKTTAQTKKTQDGKSAPAKAPKKDKDAAQRTGGFDEQQVSQWRAENARRMAESKSSIPHYYLTIDVDLDELLKLRQKLNDMIAPKGKDVKDKARGITVNDFIIKAAALACKKRPETNSVWMEKTIRQYETVDINVAINTDAGVVMTPILYNVDQKGLSAISKEVSNLSEKANSGKLDDSELESGTFTIANLGMYGITNFSAIIYPQQSAVLAIGGVENKIVPAADSPKGFRQTSVLNITLACDHRVIDGAVGAQWLQEFKQYLEQPGSMIL